MIKLLMKEYVDGGNLDTLLMIADELELIHDLRYDRIRFYVQSIRIVLQKLERDAPLLIYPKIENTLGFDFRLFRFIWTRRRHYIALCRRNLQRYFYEAELDLLHLQTLRRRNIEYNYIDGYDCRVFISCIDFTYASIDFYHTYMVTNSEVSTLYEAIRRMKTLPQSML